MSITIDKEKCSGCGACRKVCPGSLLYSDQEGKTKIRFPKDCWGCTSCVKECHSLAIHYYLGDDIGGQGSYLYTKNHGKSLEWVIVKPRRDETQTLTVDKTKANAY